MLVADVGREEWKQVVRKTHSLVLVTVDADNDRQWSLRLPHYFYVLFQMVHSL